MKLLTFDAPGAPGRSGVLLSDGKHVADLGLARERSTGGRSPELESLQALMDGGASALEQAHKALDYAESGAGDCVRRIDEVRLRAPVPRPLRIRCFSVYEKHMRQALDAVVRSRAGSFGVALNRLVGFARIPKEFYAGPVYYKGNPGSVIGPDDEIPWPTFPEEKLDYELELGFFVGKSGQDIPERNARDHIFGYTIYNDVSARDRLLDELLRGRLGPLKGKDFEGGNAIGPWIVTADEIPDPSSLRMEVRVNGETRGVGNTGEMSHSIEAMIAWASQGERLHAGEFFGTGAVGDGTGIESWKFLEPGDLVELEIERIGLLRNRVGARKREGQGDG